MSYNHSVVRDAQLLDRSLVHMAPAAALLGLARTVFGGGALDIAAVGASVAQAGGCLTQPAKRCMEYRGLDRIPNPVPPNKGLVRIKGFLVRFLDALNSTWPSPHHHLFNGAADATPAELLAECLFSHIPRQAHVVVLEFGSMAKSTTPSAVEAIVRALLDVPSPPAIVFLSVREWAHRRNLANLTLWGQHERTAWQTTESYLLRLCVHYGVSCLSYFEALAPLLYSHPPLLTLADVAADGLHPSTGRLGVDLLSEILMHWFHSALASVLASGLLSGGQLQAELAQEQPAGHRAVAATLSLGASAAAAPMAPPPRERLPAPLFRVPAGLEDAGHRRCYGFGRLGGKGRFGAYQRMAPIPWRTASCKDSATPLEQCSHVDAEPHCPRTLPAALLPATFVYCYHAFNSRGLPGKRSPGALALAAHATIELPLDTRLDAAAGTGGGAPSAATAVRVTLGYLTSYAGGMGRAQVSCHRGCTCALSTIDGHRVDADRNVSVFVPHQLQVHGAAASCVVRVRVLEQSSTLGHKFKLSTVNVASAADRRRGHIGPVGDDKEDEQVAGGASVGRNVERRPGKARGGRRERSFGVADAL